MSIGGNDGLRASGAAASRRLHRPVCDNEIVKIPQRRVAAASQVNWNKRCIA